MVTSYLPLPPLHAGLVHTLSKTWQTVAESVAKQTFIHVFETSQVFVSNKTWCGYLPLSVYFYGGYLYIFIYKLRNTEISSEHGVKT